MAHRVTYPRRQDTLQLHVSVDTVRAASAPTCPLMPGRRGPAFSAAAQQFPLVCDVPAPASASSCSGASGSAGFVSWLTAPLPRGAGSVAGLFHTAAGGLGAGGPGGRRGPPSLSPAPRLCPVVLGGWCRELRRVLESSHTHVGHMLCTLVRSLSSSLDRLGLDDGNTWIARHSSFLPTYCSPFERQK